MFTRSDDLYTQSKRKKTTWVTDAIFIPTICIFVVTNSGRSLLFYDAAKQNHIPLWIVEGIPNPIYVNILCVPKKSDHSLSYVNLKININ